MLLRSGRNLPHAGPGDRHRWDGGDDSACGLTGLPFAEAGTDLVRIVTVATVRSTASVQ
ncbi:hypothetical protein ACM614_28525 [Streptomyces sp. 12297]